MCKYVLSYAAGIKYLSKINAFHFVQFAAMDTRAQISSMIFHPPCIINISYPSPSALHSSMPL